MSSPADVALSKGSQSKTKRSFISRLPSFRKKKTPPVPKSDLDMHLRSAEEDLHAGVKIRPPSQVKNRKEDDVKRRSKTSSIVASYEKRLSDLKDEEVRTNGKNKGGNAATFGHNGSSKITQQDGTPSTNKTSRFGFGFAWQKITSFENGTTNGSKSNSDSANSDELNANVGQVKNTGSSVKSHSLELHLPHGSPPDRESTSSVRTPDSDRSSVSSNNSAKVYGQPMPYRSVFSDEPRGIKRQASSSQSEGLNSSGISMSRSTSPLHDNSSSTTDVHHASSENRLQLNSTFTKDNGAENINSDVLNRTFPIEESPTCIVNKTFKLEPAGDCGVGSHNTKATVKQKLATAVPELGRKEITISCPTVELSNGAALGKDGHDVSSRSKAQAKALGDVMPPEQDVSHPKASPARNIPTETGSTCIKTSHPSPRQQTSSTMGGMQSAVDAYSTPVRPMELSFQLRNPHISAIKHCSESLDSCELDSLCSEDLMCDTRYLDDDMFDARDESSCVLSRSLSVEETAAMYRTQHGSTTTNRARSVSVDQAQLLSTNCSLEKRVGVTRGLSPSPLAVPRGRRGVRGYPAHPVPDEPCQSPVDELQSLIYSSSCRDVDRNKNGNANGSRVRSISGGSSHPLRPPRWPTLPPDEDGAVVLDAAVYRHMVQDMTSVKTMLLKLKRALQAVDNLSSPFDHSLGLVSHCSSAPTSPLSEANPIQEVIIEDMKEENTVLRKEVKNLQEMLADAQHQLKELHVQAKMVRPEQRNVSTQWTSEMQCTSETKDQSLQVNLPPSGGEQQEKPSNVTPPKGCPLKVGHSPTSPEPPLSELSNHMETSPPERRRHPQRSLTPPSGRSSPEMAQTRKVVKPKSAIPCIPTKDNAVSNSHLPVIKQNSINDSQNASEVSQSMPASQSRNGITSSVASQSLKTNGLKKQTSRSKLIQPLSYKSKLAGSQDSLLPDGSLPDDGSQTGEDQRGGPLKRQLVYSQAPRSTGIPQIPQMPQIPQSGRQMTLELQQNTMQELNGSADGIPKSKEIRMMPSRQQSGKSSGLPQRGTLGLIQTDVPSKVGQRENGSLLPKIPSLLPVSKTAAAAKQETPTRVADRQPSPIDVNSNTVPQQNGVPVKVSGIQQPQLVRKVEQSDIRPKASPIPTSRFARRKQSPPGLARPCPSPSPERESSDEDKGTPPSSPRGTQQQRGSRIALPVRGRGTSKLSRGTGIPSRRINNS